MSQLLLNTVAEFITTGQLRPTKSEQIGYFGYVSEVHGNRTARDEIVSAVYQVIRAIREIRSKRQLGAVLSDVPNHGTLEGLVNFSTFESA